MIERGGGGGVKKTKRIGEGENKDGVRGKIRGRKEKGLRERGRTKNDWGGGGRQELPEIRRRKQKELRNRGRKKKN